MPMISNPSTTDDKPELPLRRYPDAAVASHWKEGWEGGDFAVRSIFIRGDLLRVVMYDGRTGQVEWDTEPPNEKSVVCRRDPC